MLNRFWIASVALAMSSSLTVAQTAPAPATGPEKSVGSKLSSEFRALQTAKVSLAQAIDMAERASKGRAIEAEFEAKSGPTGRYEVKVLTPEGKIVKYKLDANSGQVGETENERVEAFFTRLKPADVQNAKTSLRQALSIAEQHIAGGKAIEAKVEREGSSVLYEVEVINGDRKQEIKIDGNGQVTKD